MGISRLFFFAFSFSSFSSIFKASSDNHFAFLHFLLLGMVLITTSWAMLWTSSIVLQVLCLSDLIPWIYWLLPLTYLNALVVFPAFFDLSLNFAVRSSWSEPQSAPGFVFADCIEISIVCKEYNQSDFGNDHLVMSMCRVISCVVGRGCLLWPAHSLGTTPLAFFLLHFVLQGQTCLLLQIQSPMMIRTSVFGVSFFWSKGSCRSS